MMNHDHASMIKMIHPEGLKVTPEEQWLQIFEDMDEFGEIQSIKQKPSFHSSYENGVTTVELNYTIEFEAETFNEQLILQKESETFKIKGFFIQ